MIKKSSLWSLQCEGWHLSASNVSRVYLTCPKPRAGAYLQWPPGFRPQRKPRHPPPQDTREPASVCLHSLIESPPHTFFIFKPYWFFSLDILKLPSTVSHYLFRLRTLFVWPERLRDLRPGVHVSVTRCSPTPQSSCAFVCMFHPFQQAVAVSCFFFFIFYFFWNIIWERLPEVVTKSIDFRSS